MGLCRAAGLFCGAMACASPLHAAEQPQADFAAAMHNYSTAPPYVKIHVGRPHGALSTNCVTVNLLHGAWAIEHGADDAAVERITTASPDHVFRFANPAALANMPGPPSATELADAARLVALETPATIEQSLEGGSLSRFYGPSNQEHQRMAALACALIDRGYRPYMGDYAGGVHIIDESR